jgi:hypothetical protein
MTLEAESPDGAPATTRRARGGGGGRRGEATAATTPAPIAPGNPQVDEQLESLGIDNAPTPSAPTPAPEPAPVEPESDPEPEATEPSPPEPHRGGLGLFNDTAARDEALNPFKREQLPPPKPTKTQERDNRRDNAQAKNLQTPSTKRFGALGNKLPGAEHIKIHKRVEGGTLAYIGEYNSNDLSQSQDVESFANRYIKPSYGPGEYQITGVDAQGREFDGGLIQLLAPILPSPDMPPPAGGKSALDLVQQMIDADARRRDSEVRAMTQGQKDPIQMLRELKELEQSFTPPMPPLKPSDGSSKADPLTTMMAGMMQMMGTVLATALAPKTMDPVLGAILAKMLGDSAPKVAEDPTVQLERLSNVVKNLGGGGGGGSGGPLVDYLIKDRMTTADVLNLVDKLRGERGTDDFKKSMDNIGIMLGAVGQLRAQTEPNVSSGFWDAVSSALNNPALAQMVGVKARPQLQSGQQVRALPAQAGQAQPQQPQQRDPLALKARELAARRMRLEEVEIAERERRLGIGLPQAQPQQPVAQITPPPAAQQEPPQFIEPVVPPQPAPSRATQQPTLPPNIADHINSYLAAEDDGDVLRTTMEMIYDLPKDEVWKPYAEVIIAFIMRSDRARFLQYMASLFTSLKTIGLMDDSLVKRILDVLSRNFDVLTTEVSKKPPAAPEDEAMDGEDIGEEGEADEEGNADESTEGDEGGDEGGDEEPG